MNLQVLLEMVERGGFDCALSRVNVRAWPIFARLVGKTVVWLEQPSSPGGVWQLHEIGDYSPDEVVGLVSSGKRKP